MLAVKKVNPQLGLKPQDLVLALKLCLVDDAKRLSYRDLAPMVGLKKSEVALAVKRLHQSSLVFRLDDRLHPDVDAIREFAIYGARYAFPPIRGPIARGVRTSWGVQPLIKKLAADPDQAPVWPCESGDDVGESLYPLFPSVPSVARNDASLYELLALFDALRAGRARERNIAIKELTKRLS